ncbi:MAG TPA: PAS domain S-box protein [Leptolyngbyaceae cyanobacterium]
MNIHRQDITYGIGVLAIALGLMLVWPGLLQNLLVASGFIAHGHCYLWKPELVSLHFISDLLIGLSYVAISGCLAYLVYKSRQDIPFHWMFLLFGTFITACGGTHFMDVWTLWTPLYWLSGEVKLMTAVASVTTALVLPTLIPQILALVEAAKTSQQRKQQLEIANQELETLTQKLKEQDRLKSQFFANVSHELRTPLALILGPTENLLASEELNQQQRYSLQVVRRNARTLLKQVNDLLDVAKLEAAQMTISYAEINIGQLVKIIAAHFEPLAEQREISFRVKTPEFLSAQVDSEKLQRVFFNLLSNAFKFTPSGGNISLSVSSETAGENSVVNGSPFATITVEDSGSGVAPEFREIIFEPFRQGEQAGDPSFGGTGLGLAIVKEFVELHGGTIAVGDSSWGGAIFTIQLPLVAPPGVKVETKQISDTAFTSWGGQFKDEKLDRINLFTSSSPLPTSSVTSPPAPPNYQSPVVLVVEDNLEMNRFITEILASEYCVITAVNGREGLQKAIESNPDLILTDVMMPHMSGDRMVLKIREISQLDGVPIVLLTAKADDELRVQMLREGAQDYLMKPFSAEELKARIDNLITMKRAREILQQELASQTKDLATLAKEIQIRQRELQSTLTALQESDQRFRQLAENIHQVFWMFDTKNYQMLYISPAYEKIWGRQCQSIYEEARSFVDNVYPDDQWRVFLSLEKQIQGECTEEEYRIVKPDGSIRWIWDRGFPIKNELGEVYRIAGIAEDITQRKEAEAALQNFAAELEILVEQRTAELAKTNKQLQAEIANRIREQEALRQSEQRFRSYFELPLIGIAITSLDKGWLQVNDKLCEIFGYSRTELNQMNWAEITHPDDLGLDIAHFNRVLTGEIQSYSIEKRFIRKNGEVIHTTTVTQCVRQQDGTIDYFVALVQDITEQVKAIERLRLLESVVVNANDAVVITEAEPIEKPGPRIIYVNDAFTRLTGYTGEEIIGKTPRILQGPKSDRAALNKIRAALQKWQPVEVEIINYCKDRSEIWVELSIVPVANETGWYTHWVAIQRDITDRKQAEQALYRREQEFKTLIENSPDVVLRCDRELRYLYVNPVVEKTTGMPAATFIGKTFRELGSPENLCQLWETTLDRVFSTGKEQVIEFQTFTVNGLRNYQSRVVPELNQEGSIESALVVSRDITELKQAEEERTQLIQEQAARVYAEAQQKRFAFLAEASMILASSLDYESTLSQLAHFVVPYLADWCLVYIVKENGSICPLAVANPDRTETEKILELQRLLLVNPHQTHPILEILQTGHPAFYPELSQDRAVNGDNVFNLEIPNLSSAIVVPLIVQGKTLGVLTFAFAESKRHYSLQDLALAEELASRAAIIVDNARTHQEAREANRLKDEFLAVLSHELRTPLNAILGWATLLRSRKIDPATAERALETIERNARAQTQMVSDLLDVSRIIRGKLQLELSPVELNPIIMVALDTVRPTAEAKGIELNYFAEPVGLVAGDADALQQAIWNLLSNGIKFTPSGGRIDIRLSREMLGEQPSSTTPAHSLSPVSNSKSLTPKYARIQVSDTGQGINPNFLPYVFDRFRQENSSITRSHGGLGLGLAIVRHLVELHGGTVFAHSPGEGKGATFTIRLPLLKDEG